MNEVSIIDIKDQNLVISSKGHNVQKNNILRKLLFQWTGKEWNVIIADSNRICYKQDLIQQFKQSKEWSLILENFKEAKIIDVVINKSNNK